MISNGQQGIQFAFEFFLCRQCLLVYGIDPVEFQSPDICYLGRDNNIRRSFFVFFRHDGMLHNFEGIENRIQKGKIFFDGSFARHVDRYGFITGIGQDIIG